MNKKHWQHWKEGGGPPRWDGQRHWKGNGRFLFFRFLAVFGFMVLLVIGGMAAIGGVIYAVRGSHGAPVFALIWLVGCGLAFGLPALAAMMGRRAFRGIAAPLAELMSASEAVAQGDLTVRVSENHRGQFDQLAKSFNHMTEELARADQQRRNLTADIAHELRTPLHIIQGNLEGVIDGVYEPDAEHMEATLDETRRLARLVNDLQTLSQAEMGRLPLYKENIAVGELLEDVATSFSGQAEQKGVALEIVKPEEPLELTADIGRLEQVLGNLMVNALRHTPEGGSVILEGTQHEQHIRLTVSDTGEGITEQDLPFVFDRFWRGDQARTHANGIGGGLGLAIAKQLIRAHQGDIQVSSKPDVLTTFTIDLPAQAAA
ncbi:MAG: ATP-binding protein [Chloroflexota bacterium]